MVCKGHFQNVLKSSLYLCMLCSCLFSKLNFKGIVISKMLIVVIYSHCMLFLFFCETQEQLFTRMFMLLLFHVMKAYSGQGLSHSKN